MPAGIVFYPEPDALRIFGKDNSSYWLILFVQSDHIHSWRALYYFGCTVEAILLCMGMFFHGRSIYLCWVNKILHPSFLALMTNFYVSFQSGMFARVWMILYETKLISWTDIAATPIPFLGTMRQYAFSHGFCLLSMITFERIVATVYVADYEMKPRFCIPATQCVLSDVSILAISYGFVAGIFNGYFFMTIGLLPNIASAWIFHQLLVRNQRRLSRLSDSLRRYPNDKYSLSLRVQLKENIWSLQKIEFGVVILILVLLVNLALFFGPFFFLGKPEHMTALQWCMWSANIVLAISLSASAPIGYFAIALHTGARPCYVRWYLRHFSKKSVISPVEVKETDTYFYQLHDQWDIAMKKGIRPG